MNPWLILFFVILIFSLTLLDFRDLSDAICMFLMEGLMGKYCKITWEVVHNETFL